jgi:hypothetical protein
MVSFTPRPLYPQGKSPLYPLDRRLGGHQSRSGRGGENVLIVEFFILRYPFLLVAIFYYEKL